MKREHGAGAVQHGALCGIVFRCCAEGFLQVFGAHWTLEVEDVAGANQLSIQPEDGIGIDCAAAKRDFGAEEIALLVDRATGLERLEPQDVLPGRARAAGAIAGEAHLFRDFIRGRTAARWEGEAG